MNNNDILNKYIDLIDKGYCCDCNELNCIDNFPQAKITHAIRKLQQENKILKENAENNDKVVDKVNWENMLLKKENQELKEKLDKYENPEDMTLFAMWCTEKIKDENQKLKKQVEESKNLKNKLLVYNASIKGNWNKLKEYIKEEGFEVNTREYGSLDVIDKNVILEKMQELEKGDIND